MCDLKIYFRRSADLTLPEVRSHTVLGGLVISILKEIAKIDQSVEREDQNIGQSNRPKEFSLFYDRKISFRRSADPTSPKVSSHTVCESASSYHAEALSKCRWQTFMKLNVDEWMIRAIL